ncbi:glycosyltransferase [Algoriphagus sp. NG3]|uniref:glycosyltransferase n=1 Tax=Algoriphagus sp. NG3 TaxID=3097546 RepID=UPI002A82BF62|nr:glycosyltransferase [Algoriphagus sp. NG3]WPR77806.1 glycosyltransferase [Algoriphagus sp. NG3]
MRILFLGETYRADALTWMRGVEKESGVKICTMEVPFAPSRLKRLVYFLKFFFRIAFSSGEKWDIVMAERSTSYGFFALFVQSKIRVVAQQGITDAYPETGFSGVYKRFVQRLVYKRVDLIHAWGYVMTYAMVECGADPSKIMTLPKGINLNLYSHVRPFEFNNTIPIGIVTRSLSSIYNHHDILNAFKILKDRGVNVICWIVGGGVLEKELRDLVSTLDIKDRVVLQGKIDNDLLPEKLIKSDFYIAVPETEGVSASLFEAMSTGCFPIVTDLPSNRAFIRSGINGFLVPVHSPTRLADAIQEFLEEPERFSNGILSNRRYVEENVNFEENMKLIFKEYLRLLANKNKKCVV